MSDYVWTPDAETIENANITRLMRRLNFEVDPRHPGQVYQKAREFESRRQHEPAGYWEAALRDMEFAWNRE